MSDIELGQQGRCKHCGLIIVATKEEIHHENPVCNAFWEFIKQGQGEYIGQATMDIKPIENKA